MRVELFYFILGIIFIEYLCPLIEGLATLLLTKIEVKKGKYSEIINDINLKIEKATTSSEKTNVIGFQLPDNFEEEDENYEED